MNTVLLLMLLSSPAEPEVAASPPTAAPAMLAATDPIVATSAAAAAQPVPAAMVIGEPPTAADRSVAPPQLVEHADGGVSIVFPEGYLMRTTLRRGFNGVWFTDCGAVPTRAEPQR